LQAKRELKKRTRSEDCDLSGDESSTLLVSTSVHTKQRQASSPAIHLRVHMRRNRWCTHAPQQMVCRTESSVVTKITFLFIKHAMINQCCSLLTGQQPNTVSCRLL